MPDGVVIALVVLAIIVLLLVIMTKLPRKERKLLSLSASQQDLLLAHVPFYKNLSPEQKAEFGSRVQHFLSEVRITGVNTEITELDSLLVAASAIIPIFSFPNWEYTNLNEVMLYPETFSGEFEQ